MIEIIIVFLFNRKNGIRRKKNQVKKSNYIFKWQIDHEIYTLLYSNEWRKIENSLHLCFVARSFQAIFLGDDVTIESIDIGICSINYEMKKKKPINEQLPEENWSSTSRSLRFSFFFFICSNSCVLFDMVEIGWEWNRFQHGI